MQLLVTASLYLRFSLFFSGNPTNNPIYKTTLCQNFMISKYCSYADKCTYAHGFRELREKQPGISLAQILPEEVKKKKIEKAKMMPGKGPFICVTSFLNDRPKGGSINK